MRERRPWLSWRKYAHKVNGILRAEDLFGLCVRDGDDELLLQGHADLGGQKKRWAGCGVRGRQEREEEKGEIAPKQAARTSTASKLSRPRSLTK